MRRQLVQHLVGRSVVSLPPIAEAPGHRAEEHQEIQILRPQFSAQGESAICLRVEDAIEGLRGLILDEPILDDTGSVDDPVQPTK